MVLACLVRVIAQNHHPTCGVVQVDLPKTRPLSKLALFGVCFPPRAWYTYILQSCALGCLIFVVRMSLWVCVCLFLPLRASRLPKTRPLSRLSLGVQNRTDRSGTCSGAALKISKKYRDSVKKGYGSFLKSDSFQMTRPLLLR